MKPKIVNNSSLKEIILKAVRKENDYKFYVHHEDDGTYLVGDLASMPLNTEFLVITMLGTIGINSNESLLNAVVKDCGWRF